jgi:hypothetical protein
MKKVFLTIALGIFLCTCSNLKSMAQQNMDDTNIRACLANYFSNEGDKREKAFHPSASMKYVDIATNEFKDVPIAEFIARVKANPSNVEAKKEILSISIEGTAASAKLKMEYPTHIFYDFMNMLKIDGEWKIVSKIFYRVNK